MITNDTNTQNQKATGKLAPTKSAGLAIALLISVFTADLNAAKSVGATGNRSASAGGTRTTSTRQATTSTASRGTRTASNSATAKTQPAKTQPAGPAKTKTAKTQPTNAQKTNTQTTKTFGGPNGQVSKTRPSSNCGDVRPCTSGNGGITKMSQNFPPKAPGGDFARNRNQGGRIPEDRFRAHFGHDHSFRMDHAVMAGGHPHFGFGGFSFGVVDPLPADWLATDAVYVDSIGGAYYLCNPLHPGVQVALSVGDPDGFAVASLIAGN